MLLEIAIFVILVITFWQSSLQNTAPEQEKRHQVVSLGYFRSVCLFLGMLWNNNVPNYEHCQNFSKKYGNVMTFKHPFKPYVHGNVADMAVAKSIMGSPTWVNRLPDDYWYFDLTNKKPLGLVMGSGGYWREGRKLTLKLLNKLDFFRLENMEKFISFEVREAEKEFFGAMEENGGEFAVMTVHHKFEIYTLNIVYQVIMGKRFEDGDPIAEKLLSAMNAANQDLNLGASLLDAIPWLRHIPFLNFNRSLKELLRFCQEYFQKELIEPRRTSGSYKLNPVDFADHFLLEVDRRASDNPRYLTDENLLWCFQDLVFGGADTVNSTLEHGLLHICLKPEIQDKVQEEIDKVIGTRQPSYQDRMGMPYTQAVLWEILRYATPLALTSRCPVSDSTLGGQATPKNSLIGINLYAIHRSEEIWSEPDEFRPERFLNWDGTELVNLDKIMPFGWGKRACIGESVAKVSLFIFFVSLLQKFNFELSKAHPAPCMKNRKGLSRSPTPYFVKVKTRVPEARVKDF